MTCEPGAMAEWHSALPSKPEIAGSNPAETGRILSGVQKSWERCSIGGEPMQWRCYGRARSGICPTCPLICPTCPHSFSRPVPCNYVKFYHKNIQKVQ